MEEEADPEEQAFHSTVREYIIFLLLFGILYVASYLVLRKYLHKEKHEDKLDPDNGEATVHRISLGMCTFALTVAVGAALLLPISILSNEILLLYPSSYYVKWLNSSLISGLWNHVFLFSNLSIFILLPFAYFFSESEGIGGQQGLMGRVYEACLIQLMLAILVLGMAFVLCALIDKSQSAVELFFNVWNYLPFLYSCLSFLGVLLLLLCTPLGFARLFTVCGQIIIRPNFLSDVNDEYYAVLFEESCLRERIKLKSPDKQLNGQDRQARKVLESKLVSLEAQRFKLNQQRRSSPVLRRLIYPLAMVLLLALTMAALLNVLQNTLQLLVGIKALPLATREHFPLGLSSLSKLGLIGAVIEVVLIGYLLAASTVGLYTLPFLSGIRPTARNTPLTQLIVNCGLVLVLSSALPLLSRILGISNFDLLGNYGRIEWLGNFYLVLLYNVIFAATATLCLAKKVTNSLLLEKYYPPDFDPSKIPRVRQAKNRQFTVRLMAPFNMKCKTCGEYIYKGKKFNARKEDVENENYLGIRIYRFYIKCTRCLSEISFKTDPQSTDYVVEAGATRNFMALKLAEEQAVREMEAEKEEERTNPMKLLENRTKASRGEIEMVETLEELKELNKRKVVVNFDDMLHRYDEERESEAATEAAAEAAAELEDEQLIKAVFGERTEDGTIVKRLADDGGSSSDEDKRPKKLAKTLLPIKATDLLAAPLNNPATKNKKLNPLVKLKTALIKPNNSASSSSTIAQSTTAPSTSSTAPSAPAPVVKPSLGGLGLLGSYSDSSSHSDSDN